MKQLLGSHDFKTMKQKVGIDLAGPYNNGLHSYIRGEIER